LNIAVSSLYLYSTDQYYVTSRLRVMGGCITTDVNPDKPDVVQPDPVASDQTPVTIVVARFGSWGFSRDYGIWHDSRPDNNEEQRQALWMWFNKSSISDSATIELENFNRPEGSEKGQVLYRANFTEKPHFQIFQRQATQSGRQSYFGFFKSNAYQERDDMYYVNIMRHHSKWKDCSGRTQFDHLISKWSFASTVQIFDGGMGRRNGTDLKDGNMQLDIFGKGTVVTTYSTVTETIVDEDGNSREEVDIKKNETEFVDRIEYRLSCSGYLLAEWFIPGDTVQQEQDFMDCSLFTSKINGGWVSRDTITTTTKVGTKVDPALVMLVAHICVTEFSISEVKRDLKVNTPQVPTNSYLPYQPFQYGGHAKIN
jgi:hypothetical protein